MAIVGRWTLVLLVLLLAPLACASEEDDGYTEDDLATEYDLAGSGAITPVAPEFRPIDWVIASGTTAIVAACICAGIISLKPWEDASCVACVDSCAFKTLFCQNIIDGILCIVFVAYGIYIATAHNALPVVFVPVLVVGGVFALLVVLSTVAAKQRSCRCLLPMGSAVGILLALGEVFIGIAAWAKPATVDEWLRDIERDGGEAGAATFSEHFDRNHKMVAIVLWCFASLQFVRASVSLVVECHHWRQGRKHAGGYLQAGEDNFYVDSRAPADYFNGADYVEVGSGGSTDRGWGTNNWAGKTKSEYDDFLYDTPKDYGPLDD